MIFFKWAFLNLRRNKRLTVATSFALIFGFTGLLLLSGYISSVERYVSTQTIYLNYIGHIGIVKKGAIENLYKSPDKYLLSLNDQIEIEKLIQSGEIKDKIEMTSKKLTGFALLSAGDKNLPVVIEAYPKGVPQYITSHAEVKKWFETMKDILKPSDGISLTPELYSMMGYDNFKDAIGVDAQIMGKTLDGYINGVSEKLSGIHTTGLAFAEDVSARISLVKLQELLATDKISMYSLFLKSQNDIDFTVKYLNGKLNKLGLEVYPFNSDEIGAYYTGTMSFIRSIGFFFYSLIALVSILSIVNTLTMAINERTKEIGTLRSMGFNNSQLSNLFSLEVVILTLFAIVISSVLYYLISECISSLKIPFEPAGSSGFIYFTILISYNIMLVHGVIILGISYLTSYIACKKKLNFNIAELLNEQGVYK